MNDYCTILFGGDVAPLNPIERKILDNEVRIFDDKINQLIDESDYFIANLELPLTSTDEKRTKAGVNIKCNPEISGDLAKSGFNVFSLANNHSFDYGQKGVQDTCETLNKHGLHYYGIGENSHAASLPLYLHCKNHKIGLLTYAEHEFNWQDDAQWCTSMLEPAQNVLQIIETKKTCDALVVFLHGGPENWHYPSPRMVKNAHTFIEAGADAVLYTHAHATMGVESYNGKPIFYGLGNLIFPSTNNLNSWNKGLLVKLKVTKQGAVSYDIFHTQFNKDSDILVNYNENSKEEEFFTSISEVIKDNVKLKQHWDLFSLTQKKKLFHEVTKATTAMLPFLLFGKLFPIRKFKILYIKGATIMRGLFYCENHVDVLKNIFDIIRKK